MLLLQANKYICDFYFLPASWKNIFGLIFAVACITSVFLNGCALIKLYKKPSAVTANSDIIIAAVVLIDFFTGTLVAFLDAAEVLDESLMGLHYVDITRRYLTSTLFIATANTVTFLTVEVAYAMTKKKETRRTRSTVYALIIICIVSPGVTSIMLLFKDVAGVYALGIILQFTPVLGVILYFYSSLIIVLSSNRKWHRSGLPQDCDDEKRRREAGNVVAMITLFVVLNVPFAIHHLQYIIGHDFGRLLLAKSHTIVHFLFVLRSVLNPVIYMYRSKSPKTPIVML